MIRLPMSFYQNAGPSRERERAVFPAVADKPLPGGRGRRFGLRTPAPWGGKSGSDRGSKGCQQRVSVSADTGSACAVARKGFA